MIDDDRVFKALADPTRRRLLDRLFAQDGRTLSDLESDVDMTRFGVMKHLRLLEEAGLVVTRRSGREKLHFLNVVPIRLIHDRWIDKYTELQVSALTHLKHELEDPGTTVRVYRVYVKAAPQAIWTALVDPEWTRRYGLRGAADYDLRPGGAFRMPAADGLGMLTGFTRGGGDGPGRPAGDGPPGADPSVLVVEGEVIEADPPRRLVQTWRPAWLDEPFTRLTYEIEDGGRGVCSLTLTHDVRDAPRTAERTSGETGTGGGWPEVLSDLKSLLETGTGLYA
ncbi:ArsR/SmtB family transcription factor [Sphaerisporangium corydalis]|uniref:Metalloregulator ArsR/SmtB family transcription factor n=1 Tax=Sphaerisporangium corydalis TaxID=1441875 RepID=A0ABV9ES82_9ACTN|nr:metalloregulator ArsR/SmtB family transcription factor [Sphaerisporangium corydalis]